MPLTLDRTGLARFWGGSVGWRVGPGCVGVCVVSVFAGSRHTEPQASLSEVTGTCVPAWPSLCSCSPHPGRLSGSQTAATASRRQEGCLPSSPPPSSASGAGGTSPTCPCSLTHHPGLPDWTAGSLALPMAAFVSLKSESPPLVL